jgi:uncharacterized sodium:solute symporter family permease YidK
MGNIQVHARLENCCYRELGSLMFIHVMYYAITNQLSQVNIHFVNIHFNFSPEVITMVLVVVKRAGAEEANEVEVSAAVREFRNLKMFKKKQF